MLKEDPCGLSVVFNEITTGMLIEWGKKRDAYLGDREIKDLDAVEWWSILVKAAIVCKWFDSPSDWVEGSVAKLPPSHTHWLSDLVWLHSIELKRVPFLSG